jgi:hypothetical protein
MRVVTGVFDGIEVEVEEDKFRSKGVFIYLFTPITHGSPFHLGFQGQKNIKQTRFTLNPCRHSYSCSTQPDGLHAHNYHQGANQSPGNRNGKVCHSSQLDQLA